MSMLNSLAKSYLKSWETKIKEEEKYLKCKDCVLDMQDNNREPFKYDLETVSKYENKGKEEKESQWNKKETWIGEAGSYYYDMAADWIGKRRCE